MILGVTGGIASGKSLVVDIFRSLGAAVVSADQLARRIVQRGSPVLEKIVERFGVEALHADGSLHRKFLAERIFNDDGARADLNRITHPAIAELAAREFAELTRRGARLIVYEAPLLFEAGVDRQVDAVLVVTVPPEVQLARLMARDGISCEAARQRIAAQLPQPEKMARADYLVDNSGTPEETRRQVAALMEQMGFGPSPSRRDGAKRSAPD
jgi:dephospho-CoA kinase